MRVQAFKNYAFDRRAFGSTEVRAQMAAAEQAGSNGWMLWSPRNVYSADGLASKGIAGTAAQSGAPRSSIGEG